MNAAYRRSELGAIRSLLDHTEPSLIHVTGPRGVGKSTLVRSATEGIRGIVHRVPPLPAPQQLAALVEQLSVAGGLSPDIGASHQGSLEVTWASVLALLADAAAPGHPVVLVLDDAHRLTQSRARIGASMARTLATAGERGIPFHVVLVGAAGGLPDISLPRRPGSSPVAVPHPLTVRVPPLPLRAALPWLPGSVPEDRIRAYSVFGGIPAHLKLLDPQASLWTNMRRVYLEAGAPLADLGLDLLERDVQVPARYVAVLAGLATGESDWAAIHRGVPDLTTSGQVAPYLRRLEELGLVDARRSLDAAPRSRSRRYRIVDPSVAFWFRFVLPFRHAHPAADPGAWMDTDIRPALDHHVAAVFPEVCRQHMALDAMEWAGANAREIGSVWGPDRELDVAGTLTSGAAFYGRTAWGAAPVDADALDALDAMIGETRYGFGKERRLRIVFSTAGTTSELARHLARRDDVALVDGRALVGVDEEGRDV